MGSLVVDVDKYKSSLWQMLFPKLLETLEELNYRFRIQSSK